MKVKNTLGKPRRPLWTSLIAGAGAIWLCCALYNAVADYVFFKSGEGSELIRYGTTLIETHYAGLKVDKSGIQSASISPWLTQTATLRLYKPIGKWEKVVGTVDLKKPLGGDISYEIHYDAKDLLDRDGTFHFAVPPDLLGKPPFNQRKEQEKLWEQLKRIEDGYVAEMAFSTRSGQKPEELLQLLETYDLIVLQMPVYAGERKTFETLASSSGEIMNVPHLSLRPPVFYHYEEGENENQVSGYQLYMDDAASATAAVKQFLPDLEWLLTHGKSGFEGYDTHRLDYLRKSGVTVYGAVVTGPVRELEKLRENQLFHEFQLGRIEVWNW